LPFRLLIAAVMQRVGPHHAACQGSCLVKADNTDISGSFELAGIEHVDSFQPQLLCARPQCTNDDCRCACIQISDMVWLLSYTLPSKHPKTYVGMSPQQGSGQSAEHTCLCCVRHAGCSQNCDARAAVMERRVAFTKAQNEKLQTARHEGGLTNRYCCNDGVQCSLHKLCCGVCMVPPP